jgi:diaminohydroxyphosphoribosylaminopyrimidine deaminase/5-amino-6-(5-phosphoribosylamino)uracil reductase
MRKKMKASFSKTDISFMREALKEARKGLGRTSPNPCVGAVIVKEGEIIGKGYHKKAGMPHAEINALRTVGEEAEGADMYVTLEPCNHTGRTPPCSHAVAASGIKNVFIGMLDPNPLVDGGGADYLRTRNIGVRHGLLEDECRVLNRPFLTYTTKGRPWTVMKAGLTLDGRLTFKKNRGDRITGAETYKQVHRLRDQLDAILVGVDTVRIDNPSLTTRLKGHSSKNPIRVILDTSLRIPLSASVVSDLNDGLTWVFCSMEADRKKRSRLVDAGVKVVQTGLDEAGRLDVRQVVAELASLQVTSLLVEGGGTVHGSFLRSQLVDHVKLFYAPVFGGDGGTGLVRNYRVIGGGENAPRLERVKQRRFGDDLMVSGDVIYPARA